MIEAEMYGMIVEREDRHAAERAAGEHVEHAEDAAGVLARRSRPGPCGSMPGIGI